MFRQRIAVLRKESWYLCDDEFMKSGRFFFQSSQLGLTLTGNAARSRQVHLIADEDDGVRGDDVTTPQEMKEILGDGERTGVDDAVDDDVGLRVVRRHAVLDLQ